jgi:hypothetical protein
MATINDGGDEGPIPGDVPAVDFAQYRARRLRVRLLDLLDALIVAMERRDLQAVWDVLDEDDAIRWFPAGLREEALVFARLPAASLRAPIRAYQYHHQLCQLADEPLALTDDPRQLSLDLAPSDQDRRSIQFPGRTGTAPEDPRRGGGTDRRRSGSR